MQKEQLTKPDGRYIIFYSFDEDEPSGQYKSMESQPVLEPKDREEQE